MAPSQLEPGDYNAIADSATGEEPLSDESASLELTLPPETAGLRLDQALAKLLPDYSRSRLAAWIKSERVLLDAEVAQPKTKVWGGETVLVLPELSPEERAFAPEPMPLDIVFEDESILVLNKPAGLVVHPGHGNWSGTLLNGLLAHDAALADVPRAGIVHRLDKDTSGLMVVAKTIPAQTELVRQLQARSVKRHYWALLQGVLKREGRVDAPIGRHPRDRLRMAVRDEGATGAKPAITHFAPLEGFTDATLVECRLETGRTHQIRVHMQSIGHPLVGDPVYGGGRTQGCLPRQALHAKRLGLIHPRSRDAMQWEVPLPDDMIALLDATRLEGRLPC